MNKIHYTSGSFYIEKDGKKIKIANPELLPVQYYDMGQPTWLNSNSCLVSLNDNDTFDLPKEISVRIVQDTCKVKCKRPITICPMGSCASKDVVAILSKSSSPEIPDSSENNTVKVDWQIKGAVVCPKCEHENDFMDVDEWWCIVGLGESKYKFTNPYEITCDECKHKFKVDGSEY